LYWTINETVTAVYWHALQTYRDACMIAAKHFYTATFRAFVIGLFLASSQVEGACPPCQQLDDQPEASQQRAGRVERGIRRVFSDRIEPHWFVNSQRFWYRNDLAMDAKEFVVVDAEKGTRSFAFDHQAVALAFGEGADARRRWRRHLAPALQVSLLLGVLARPGQADDVPLLDGS